MKNNTKKKAQDYFTLALTVSGTFGITQQRFDELCEAMMPNRLAYGDMFNKAMKTKQAPDEMLEALRSSKNYMCVMMRDVEVTEIELCAFATILVAEIIGMMKDSPEWLRQQANDYNTKRTQEDAIALGLDISEAKLTHV